jgi:hypothetical protein
MEQKPVKLPPLEELKELLNDVNNLIFYNRIHEVEGPADSMRYLKKKQKEFYRKKRGKV